MRLRPTTTPYLFGDLLAIARESWVEQMATRLGAQGFDDYRRSDAAVMRLLARRPLAVARLAEALGVTRQAARKVVSVLEVRGYVTLERPEHDSRQRRATLTPYGRAYAQAVVQAIDDLNRQLSIAAAPEQLAAADAVLRVVIGVEGRWAAIAGRLPPPLPPPALPSAPGHSQR